MKKKNSILSQRRGWHSQTFYEELKGNLQEIEVSSELRQQEENQDTSSISFLFQLDFIICDLNEFVDNLVYGHVLTAKNLHMGMILKAALIADRIGLFS